MDQWLSGANISAIAQEAFERVVLAVEDGNYERDLMFEKLRNWITGRPSNEELTALVTKFTDGDVTPEEELTLARWVEKGWLSVDVWETARRARARRLDRERSSAAPKEKPADNAHLHPPYQQVIVTDDHEDAYYDGGAARWDKFDGPREKIGDTVCHKSGFRVPLADIPEAQKVEEAPAPREVPKAEPEVAPPPHSGGSGGSLD